MRLSDVIREKEETAMVSARVKKAYAEYIKTNKINVRRLIEKAIDEIEYVREATNLRIPCPKCGVVIDTAARGYASWEELSFNCPVCGNLIEKPREDGNILDRSTYENTNQTM